MCMQCISVQDDQPTQRLLLKANSCNVHCATCWWLKTGPEKLDNELTTTLFENITTLAQPTPVHACWRKNNKIPVTRPEETSHNSIGHSYPRFPPEYVPTTPSRLVSTLVEICCRRVERSHHTPHLNSWTFVPDHPTISNLTFRSHSPSVDVFACYVSTTWPLLCTHRTTQKQSHQIETCRAWLEYTIEFDSNIWNSLLSFSHLIIHTDSRMILILLTIPFLIHRFQWRIVEAMPLLENRYRVAPVCHEVFPHS